MHDRQRCTTVEPVLSASDRDKEPTLYPPHLLPGVLALFYNGFKDPNKLVQILDNLYPTSGSDAISVVVV
jgi:hypothetical protein